MRSSSVCAVSPSTGVVVLGRHISLALDGWPSDFSSASRTELKVSWLQ